MTKTINIENKEKKIRKNVILSGADRVFQTTSARNNVDAIPKVKNMARRHRAERSALFFMRYYCTGGRGSFLKMSPPPQMRKIVHQMQESVTDGIPYHIRMPRGHGKSSFVKGVVMWAVVNGYRHFVQIVAANERKAKSMVRDIWQCMAGSKAFAEDYPEISAFIAKCKGNWRHAPSISFGADKYNVQMKFSNNEANLPTVEVDGKPTVSSGAILLGVGFSSNVRGEVAGNQRPDLIVFDDLQDAEMAASQERVMEAKDLINGDFLGSDSHTDNSSAFMTSTPICPDDLSEQLAKDPYWRNATYKMLASFPEAFSPTNEDTLWGKFAAIWRHENINGRDPHIECNKFYLEHQAEMDKGAKVLNPKNFKPNEISAIEHAMILYYTKGSKTFAAEYQMKPRKIEYAFEITPKIILSRIRADVIEGQIPKGFVYCVAATDINPSYALTTSVVAFDPNRTALVVKNKITPIRIDDKLNDTQFVQQIYGALTALGKDIRSWGLPIAAWGIDCSGKQWDAVLSFAKNCKALTGLSACAMTGRSQMKHNLLARNRLRDPINHTVLCGDIGKGLKWMTWDADLYKETAQRSWATEAGAAGGCSLHSGIDHDEFAVQVSNERLRYKKTRQDNRCEYFWQTKEPHDYGDCMAMCYAIAASQGIAAGGCVTGTMYTRPRRKKIIIK